MSKECFMCKETEICFKVEWGEDIYICPTCVLILNNRERRKQMKYKDLKVRNMSKCERIFPKHNWSKWKIEKKIKDEYGNIRIIQKRICLDCGRIELDEQGNGWFYYRGEE